MSYRYEYERDSDCRAYIITCLDDKGKRIPVAYDGHPGHPGKEILELMLPDRTIRNIVEMRGKNKEKIG